MLRAWTRMFKPNWQAIACDNGLGRTELRVLILSAVSLGHGNRINLSQREMAEALGLTPSAINRAMRLLVDGGLILQDGHRYTLNSRLCADQPLPELIYLRHEEAKALRRIEASYDEIVVEEEVR